MKTYFLLFLFWSFSISAQTDIFKVETITTDDSKIELGYKKLKHYSSYFYEDENYTVTTECHGEFGGKIFFKNKKDGIVTVGRATCPVIINKIDSKYYLTTSLTHMDGFYNFYEIDDPKELAIKANDSVYQSERELTSGMKTLAGGMGKTILLSFEYKKVIYHIVCDRDADENYLAVRENAVLKKIQLLNKLPMRISYETSVTKEGHYVAMFSIMEKGRLRSGYIDIFEDHIKIYLCK